MRGADMIRSRVFSLMALGVAGSLAIWLAACGGGNVTVSGGFNPPQGTVSVSITDPPSCKFPAGSFQSVWVTIRSVQAHISTTAGDGSSGWQELAPGLANSPLQVDLLAIPQGGCVLAMLGSNVTLPAGDYQQIRLILLSNTPGAGQAVPANNACASVNAYNCVVRHASAGGTTHRLLLNSQDLTGLKIPPGQIVGGPIRVASGQHADINIDFNTCASLLRQGNGEYRMRPVLTAGQVSSVNSGLSGRVVDAATMQPLASTPNPAEVLVALEQPDSAGTDRIIMQAAADASGNFNFCPVPAGTYDLVAVGQDGAGVTYGATVLTGVPAGSNVGNIPLIAQPAGSAMPGTIQGVVTSENAGAGASVDAAVNAFQNITVGGSPRQVTIPLFNSSVSNFPTAATPTAGFASPCPANTFCEGYSLLVPAQNPSFGAFSTSGTMFSAPAAAPVPFAVEVRAFRPMSGGTATCSPSSKSTTMTSLSAPLEVTAGAPVTAARLDFTACN